MNRVLGTIAVVSMTLAFSASAWSQVQVSAAADTSSPIYLGNPFTYSITIENGDESDQVDLSPLKEFNPSGPSRQSRISNINGRVSSSIVYSYALTPPRLGQINIPPIEVTIKGKTYRTNPVTVTVTQPGQTRQMDIEMEISDSECYVGQPVLLTVTFYVWLNLVREEAVANISMNLPVFQSSEFYVEEPDAVPFRGPQTVLIVNGQKQSMVQDQVDHKGVTCVRVRFAKTLIARQAGEITIDPAAVGADIAVARRQSRDSFFGDFFGRQYEYKRFSASSMPLQLTVRPLPEEGKPADFYGLVGRYTITASADPVQVNVGDPITLTIRVGGSSFLKPVQWPDLEAIKGMTDDFKIPAEKADPEIKDGRKIFTHTIRASHEKVNEIPPIPLSFFDVQKGKYTTIRTDPIPLSVSPTRIVTGADVESRQFSSVARQIEAVREGLSANVTGPEALVSQHVTLASVAASPLVLLLWLGPLTGLLLSGLYKLSVRTSPQRQAARRRKNAIGRALRQIHAADKQANPGPVLCAALKQYIADKLDKVPGSLTAEDCTAMLKESAVRTDCAEDLRRMMEALEAAQYSPTAYVFSKEEKNRMIALLKEIEKQIR